MVKLREGDGMGKNVDLLVVDFVDRKEDGSYAPVNVAEEGKFYFPDIQINMVNGENSKGPIPPTSDFHLRTYTDQKTGRVNNSARYMASQMEAMQEAAGDNVVYIPTQKNPDRLRRVASIKAESLMVRNGGLLVNTKEGLSQGPAIDENIINGQFEIAKQAKLDKEATREAPEPEAAAPEATEAAKPAAKKPAARTRKAKVSEKVAEAEAPVEEAPAVSTDEPSL